LSAPTRTSSAFTDLPLASGFFTAAFGVFGSTSLAASPSRFFTSQVPSCATRKYV